MHVANFIRKTFWLIAAALVLLTGCTDSDEAPDERELLLGNWAYQSSNIQVFLNDVLIPPLLLAQFGFDASEMTAPFKTLVIEIRADDTFVATAEPEPPISGRWYLNGDNTILTLDDGSPNILAFNILSLSRSELKLQLVDEQEQEEEGQTLLIRVEFELQMGRTN